MEKIATTTIQNRYQDLVRGVYYSPLKTGGHSFRFDLRYGSVKIFVSQNDVTLKVTNFAGRTLCIAKAWMVSGKLRTFRKYQGKISSGSNIFEFDFCKVISRKRDYFDHKNIKATLVAALRNLVLTHQPWRAKEVLSGYGNLLELPYAGCPLEEQIPFHTEILLNCLWYPAFKASYRMHNYGVGYTPWRHNSRKKVLQALFRESGKNAASILEKIEAGALESVLGIPSTNLAPIFNSAKKAGWTTEQMLQNVEAFVNLGRFPYKEVFNYSIEQQKKLLGFIGRNKDSFLVGDTFRMLDRINQQLGQPFPVRRVKTLRELHDALGYVTAHIQEPDYKLWQHPEFTPFNGVSVLGHTIVFPEKNSDLKYWGATLGICVGGYGDKIHKGKSIVFALYIDNKPVVCVEIQFSDKVGRYIITQIYGASNTPVKSELIDCVCNTVKLNYEGDSYGYYPHKTKLVAKEYKSMLNNCPIKTEQLDISIKKVEKLFQESLYKTQRRQELDDRREDFNAIPF